MTKELIDIVKHLLKHFDVKLNKLHSQVTQEIVSTITTGSPVELATVATSGSYNDLIDKPNINPSVVYNTNLYGIDTTTALGNIPQGTSVEDLKNRPFTEILDLILFKEIWPNITYTHTILYSTLPTIIKEGTNINWPTVTTNWNPNIVPVGNISYTESIKNPDNEIINRPQNGTTETNVSGNWIYELKYSYPAGLFTITSNYGNDRQENVPAVNNAVKTSTIKVTRPVIINNLEQTLFAINTQTTITKTLGGSPVIKVPWINSEISIEVDLGFGYMPVNNWSLTTETINGWEYKVFTKNDTYYTAVPHKFTIKLIK